MAALLCATMPLTAAAQSYSDLRRSASPLVLRAQGSFYVGGEVVEQSFVERGSFGPPGPGHLTIHQMYVEYMIPASHRHSAPVVMVHGMGLSGKTWETTPDGRMGWDEYFVRRGHASYVIDQVSRARSGFNQAIYNNVRAGLLPPGSQPPMRRFSDEMGWGNFRFGTGPGAPFPDEQFPVEFLDELAKQNVPDLNGTLPTPNPTYRALATLAVQVKGAVVMTHSQSGRFGVEAALTDAAGMKGLILVEPGSCQPTRDTDQQIATLARIPILVVFGDNLDAPTGVAGFSWRTSFEGCQAFIARVNAAGGNARMLYLPSLGIPGNSHMLMQDKNNRQVADLILAWMDRNVDTGKHGDKGSPHDHR
jgi:pimeloyl-ACP methyl ester carboxylesterase